MLTRKDVAELASLLLEPRDRLRVGDLLLSIRDLLRQRPVLHGK